MNLRRVPGLPVLRWPISFSASAANVSERLVCRRSYAADVAVAPGKRAHAAHEQLTQMRERACGSQSTFGNYTLVTAASISPSPSPSRRGGPSLSVYLPSR